MSSSIPSWQTLTAHVQPFRGARDLAFFLKVPLDSLLIWASSEGSGETARMRRLAWTFAARIGYKYQIRLTRSIYYKSNHETEKTLPNNSLILGHPKNRCNYPKIRTMWLYHRVMSPTNADGMACRPLSDCSSKNSLIWVYTVCPGLSVRKLRFGTIVRTGHRVLTITIL